MIHHTFLLSPLSLPSLSPSLSLPLPLSHPSLSSFSLSLSLFLSPLSLSNVCICSMDQSDSMVHYQILPTDVLECRVSIHIHVHARAIIWMDEYLCAFTKWSNYDSPSFKSSRPVSIFRPEIVRVLRSITHSVVWANNNQAILHTYKHIHHCDLLSTFMCT